MTDATLVREKLDQVPAILEEHGVDLWLTFVHETQVTPDPCIELIVGTHVTWQSAFLLSRSGERTAIVGRFDAPGLQKIGAYSDLQTYDESVRPALLETIERLDPEKIALNYSPSDPAADGLTHGMWLVLRETLEGTPYADRLVSSAQVVGSLRGRKTSFEIERIRNAIDETEEIFALVGEQIRARPDGDGDRGRLPRGGLAARPGLRVGGGAVSRGERRDRRRRSVTPGRQSCRRSAANCSTPTSECRRTSTAATCSVSGIC